MRSDREGAGLRMRAAGADGEGRDEPMGTAVGRVPRQIGVAAAGDIRGRGTTGATSRASIRRI